MNTPENVPPVINRNYIISYDFTRWDVLFNWMTVMVRNRFLQILVPVSMLVITGLRVFPQIGRQSVFELILSVFVDCAGFLIFLVVIQTICGFASAFLMQHRGVVCRHTLEITDEGLLERTDVNTSLHRWSGICRVFSFGGYFFIYIGENNVHQVPKRGIARDAMKGFEDAIRCRIKVNN